MPLWDWDGGYGMDQRQSEQMLDMTSSGYCTAAGLSSLTFGHGWRMMLCSRAGGGGSESESDRGSDGWNQILRVAVPEAEGDAGM